MDDHPMIPPIFLSASEPNPERDRKYWQGRNLLNVREAVRRFCAHILTHYPLVYGGHPAITPLVNQVAERVAHQSAALAGRQEGPAPPPPKIMTFQSSLYLDPSLTKEEVVVTPEGIAITPAHEQNGSLANSTGGWRNASLLRMRYEMLGTPGARPVHLLGNYASTFGIARKGFLQTDEFSAAVFIGGMEGVEREFRIFRSFHPNTPAYPISSTGSVCADLLGEVERYVQPALFEALRDQIAYNLLMQELFPIPAPPLDVAARRQSWHPDRRTEDASSHIDPEKIDRPRPPR
jgi:hypothetical protein